MAAKKSVRKVARKAQEKLDPQRYRTVLSEADLLDVKLVDLQFHVEPTFFAESAKDDKALEREFSFLPKSVSVEKRGAAIGFFEGALIVRRGKKVELALTAEYLVAFSVKTTDFDAEIKAYVEQVGRLASFPYFRQLVSSTSNMAGARLPTLPVIKEWATINKERAVVRRSE